MQEVNAELTKAHQAEQKRTAEIKRLQELLEKSRQQHLDDIKRTEAASSDRSTEKSKVERLQYALRKAQEELESLKKTDDEKEAMSLKLKEEIEARLKLKQSYDLRSQELVSTRAKLNSTLEECTKQEAHVKSVQNALKAANDRKDSNTDQSTINQLQETVIILTAEKEALQEQLDTALTKPSSKSRRLSDSNEESESRSLSFEPTLLARREKRKGSQKERDSPVKSMVKKSRADKESETMETSQHYVPQDENTGVWNNNSMRPPMPTMAADPRSDPNGGIVDNSMAIVNVPVSSILYPQFYTPLCLAASYRTLLSVRDSSHSFKSTRADDVLCWC